MFFFFSFFFFFFFFFYNRPDKQHAQHVNLLSKNIMADYQKKADYVNEISWLLSVCVCTSLTPVCLRAEARVQ